MPVDRVELDHELVGLGAARRRRRSPAAAGGWNTSRSSVCVTGRHLPVRMKNGTPDQRQLSISSRSAAYVSVVESRRDAVDRRGSRRTGRARSARGRPPASRGTARPCASLSVSASPAAGGSIAAAATHLHQVVDDDVAQRADRVVEVAAVLDAEALGHRDLHRRDVVAVPDRLEASCSRTAGRGSRRGPSSRGSGRSGRAATRRCTGGSRRRARAPTRGRGRTASRRRRARSWSARPRSAP